jgi:ATP-dependent protease Clp ATPase subunit
MAFHAAGGSIERAESAVVVLDEFCKLAWDGVMPAGVVPDGSARFFDPKAASVRLGRQQSILSLLDRSSGLITFVPTPGEAPRQLRSGNLVVICAGVFRGLQQQGARPSDQELEAAGLIPELVSRLPVRLMLQSPDVSDLMDLLTHGTDAVVPSSATCAAFGYQLVIAPEAVRMVAAATASGTLTTRTGAAVIEAAVRHALLDVLHGRSPSDGTLRIGPDEVMSELQAVARPNRLTQE